MKAYVVLSEKHLFLSSFHSNHLISIVARADYNSI
jgi:hypothetical protein